MAFSLSQSIPIVLEEYGGEEVSWVGPIDAVGWTQEQAMVAADTSPASPALNILHNFEHVVGG